MNTKTERLLTRLEVEKVVSLSRSAIYRLMRSGDFPEPIQVGTRAVRWRLSEIQEWLESRPRASGQKARIA